MHSAATVFCQSAVPCCQHSSARSISFLCSGHRKSAKCRSTADCRPRSYWNAARWAGSTLKCLEQSLGECSAAIRADKQHYTHDNGSRTRNRKLKDQLVESCDAENCFVQSESSNPELSAGYDIKATISNSHIHGSLKFAVLLGLLILHGSSQAIAADLATATQVTSFLGDLGDISTGFASAFLLIFFSELGDKTFFIAALLAARNSGAVVFAGTFGALATMTIISVVLGRTFHYVDGILPFRFGETDLPIDDIAAVCLLVYFGVTTLIDAVSDDSSKANEEQKEAELAVSDFSGNGAGILAAANTAISTFALVFVAEWGDKSFFSTIALAAASSPLGVIAGALAGHAVATLLAVVGGSILGTYFSEKAISYVGGSLFLIFAVVTLLEIFT